MIYLDNSAGTRPFPQVIETITDVLQNHWGNASADNIFGNDARNIINDVTEQVALDINCYPEDIIWTSGAAEANSLAIHGTLDADADFIHCHTQLEHPSVSMARGGSTKMTYVLANDNQGYVDTEELKETLKFVRNMGYYPFVSVCFASSDIGTIQDIKSIAKLVHKYGGILHTDATQMYPWHKIDVQELEIDLMSVSGQKLNCAKGIGFLYVNKGVFLNPIIYGTQQNERRGGTYPTHLIAAFGKALEITRDNDTYDQVVLIEQLRNRLLMALQKVGGVHLNGPGVDKRLPNNISLTIDGVKADTLVAMCDLLGVVIAKGSACKSHEPTPSEALMAIGLTEEQALNTIRISLGRHNTIEEIDEAANIITKLIERIRGDE